LIQHLGYRASFLGLSGIAFLAFGVLWFAIPETLSRTSATSTSGPEIDPTSPKEAFAQ
jgi:predicted MFS family arabinose efflux permease